MHGEVGPVKGYSSLSNARGGDPTRLTAVLRLYRGTGIAGQISDGTLQNTVGETGQWDPASVVWVSVCTRTNPSSAVVPHERLQRSTYVYQDAQEVADSIRLHGGCLYVFVRSSTRDQ